MTWTVSHLCRLNAARTRPPRIRKDIGHLEPTLFLRLSHIHHQINIEQRPKIRLLWNLLFFKVIFLFVIRCHHQEKTLSNTRPPCPIIQMDICHSSHFIMSVNILIVSINKMTSTVPLQQSSSYLLRILFASSE